MAATLPIIGESVFLAFLRQYSWAYWEGDSLHWNLRYQRNITDSLPAFKQQTRSVTSQFLRLLKVFDLELAYDCCNPKMSWMRCLRTTEHRNHRSGFAALCTSGVWVSGPVTSEPPAFIGAHCWWVWSNWYADRHPGVGPGLIWSESDGGSPSGAGGSCGEIEMSELLRYL